MPRRTFINDDSGIRAIKRYEGIRLVPKKIATYRPLHAPTEKERQKQFKETRKDKETNKFYSSRAWRKTRAAFLAQYPLCVECENLGRDEPATVVDHLVEIKEDPSLAHDFDNLRPLCTSCHNTKTGRNVMRKRYG
jgi:5-methylcytosine-specific restriction protein A